MTEDTQEAPIEFIGTEKAATLATHVHTLYMDALLGGRTPHTAVQGLWNEFQSFATPVQVATVEALIIERGDDFGLTPPEVVALPPEVQRIVRRYRSTNAARRNSAQQAYETRTGAEGLFSLAEREAREARERVQAEREAHREREQGLRERADAVGVSRAAMRSAELLDRQLPGWEQFIDLDVLDMGSTDQCILGQLASQDGRLSDYVNYNDTVEFLRGQEPVTFGHETAFASYGSEWLKIISGRRSATPAE